MLKYLKHLSFLTLISIQQIVLAADVEFCPDGTEKDPTIGCIEAPAWIIDPSEGLSGLMIQWSNLLLVFAGSIATLMLVYSGVQYSLAMGDDEKIDTAKRNMKWSIVGLGISISAYAIVEFVLKSFI